MENIVGGVAVRLNCFRHDEGGGGVVNFSSVVGEGRRLSFNHFFPTFLCRTQDTQAYIFFTFDF